MRKNERQGTAKTIKWLRRFQRITGTKAEALHRWMSLPPSEVQTQVRGTKQLLRINDRQMAYAFRRVFGVGIDSIERIWEVES